MNRYLPGIALLAALGIATFWFWPRPQPEPEPGLTFQVADGGIKHLDSPLGDERLLPEPQGPIPQGQRLLVVTWDTVRADKTSAYGYERDTTPTLKSLAEGGVRFADFVVPQSTTLPTHVSIFTGTHPEEHGVIGNSAGGKYAFVPPEALPTLASHLTDNGYLTAGFVSSAPLKKYSGISDGFQIWNEPTVRVRSALATTESALSWLANVDEERPWLLWVHMYDPHAPYRAPQAMLGTLGEHDFTAELTAAGVPTDAKYAPKALKRWREHYDLEIRACDDQLRRLVQAVEARFPDTVVTVVGDHGEGLGQHGHKEHGLVWPEQLLSPWVLAGPGIDAAVVKTPTTAADVLPTLVAAADLPDEATLLANVTGSDARAELPTDRAILSRTSPRQLMELEKTADIDTLSWALTTSKLHYIWHPTAPAQLFDRAADPHALHDIASEHPDQIEAFAKVVAERREQMHAKATQLGSGRTKALGAETAEELKALGYLD